MAGSEKHREKLERCVGTYTVAVAPTGPVGSCKPSGELKAVEATSNLKGPESGHYT